ncbi:hypothetical protein M011DRAFT_524568 [Sporormia fimetaria CBS 119925]|uniref:Uncharacterized protein n=1 Tax=Sporormia fimetaria CBS 119925 TaxID=1340428 RepID=A0A6A6VK97_9PLEO|nr:hypothetical protein M011DRAFT_524568 [Sporormia fimetaria CBS 119925]
MPAPLRVSATTTTNTTSRSRRLSASLSSRTKPRYIEEIDYIDELERKHARLLDRRGRIRDELGKKNKRLRWFQWATAILLLFALPGFFDFVRPIFGSHAFDMNHVLSGARNLTYNEYCPQDMGTGRASTEHEHSPLCKRTKFSPYANFTLPNFGFVFEDPWNVLGLDQHLFNQSVQGAGFLTLSDEQEATIDARAATLSAPFTDEACDEKHGWLNSGVCGTARKGFRRAAETIKKGHHHSGILHGLNNFPGFVKKKVPEQAQGKETQVGPSAAATGAGCPDASGRNLHGAHRQPPRLPEFLSLPLTPPHFQQVNTHHATRDPRKRQMQAINTRQQRGDAAQVFVRQHRYKV